jgi:hypothetical protein
MLYQFLIFSLYSTGTIGVEARTRAASFFHTGNAPTWCGSDSGSGSGPLSVGLNREKIQKLIFSPVYPRPKDSSQSQNRICIIFSCLNSTNIMRLRFWLQIKTLYFCLNSEKNQQFDIRFWFCHYIGQRIGVGARAKTGAASTWCGSNSDCCCDSGSSSDTYPFGLYSEKNPTFYINL